MGKARQVLQQGRDFLGDQHVESGTREVLPEGAQGRSQQRGVTEVTELYGEDLHDAALGSEYVRPARGRRGFFDSDYPSVVSHGWGSYVGGKM